MITGKKADLIIVDEHFVGRDDREATICVLRISINMSPPVTDEMLTAGVEEWHEWMLDDCYDEARRDERIRTKMETAR